MQVTQSSKLANVCYDIRGPVLRHARKLEAEGHHILKLNIGNPAPFGFDAPEEILQDVILNLSGAHGYGDSKGLLSARRAVVQYYQQRGVYGLDIEDVYLGNGASELIVMAMQALLDNGDEVLIPAPDYPLWTAAVSLSGGRPVHYICDEGAGWFPDVNDVASKITDRLFAGEKELDLGLALEVLNCELGLQRLLLEGGGSSNGSSLNSWVNRSSYSSVSIGLSLRARAGRDY